MLNNTVLIPIRTLSEKEGISERELAEKAEVSRACLRAIKSAVGNVTVQSLAKVASSFGLHIETLGVREHIDSSMSIVAVGYLIERDGFESWKIHLMNFVDEFRRTLDPRLIILPPPRTLDKKLQALLLSSVRFLCGEVKMPVPSWAGRRIFLETPWFPSGVESLKASALVESPLSFRDNNIFVLNNFLDRT